MTNKEIGSNQLKIHSHQELCFMHTVLFIYLIAICLAALSVKNNTTSENRINSKHWAENDLEGKGPRL